jgi:1-deoxy-D-xylulose-5-phosphate reductoisomerase
VYNAANEECVTAFHQGQLAFPAIVDTVATVLGEHEPGNVSSVDDVLAAEAWARTRAKELTGTDQVTAAKGA